MAVTRVQDGDNARASKTLRILNERGPDLTAQQISDATNIPRSTIDKMLTNRAPIRIGQFTLIAKVLGYTAAEAITEFEQTRL